MDSAIDKARALAIVRLSRTPGFPEMLKLLDELSDQAKNEAFICDDESRAMRLLHEGRGAMQLVHKFKAAVASLTEDALQPQPESQPDW